MGSRHLEIRVSLHRQCVRMLCPSYIEFSIINIISVTYTSFEKLAKGAQGREIVTDFYFSLLCFL